MSNYLKITIFIFAIIPFSIIYFCWLFGFYDALKEFVEKVVWFIIFGGLSYKVFTIFIDWCMSRSSEYQTPTPQVEVQNSEVRGVIEAKSTDNQSESRGFDWSKQKQGSPEAANAYKQSQEHHENQNKLRTLDELIKSARQEINAQ